MGPPALPVLTTPTGSMRTAWTSPSATGQCSTPRGTTNSWPADYLKVVGSIPPAVRRPIESFLAAAVPEANFAPAFCHNDLGAEHVLVDSDSRECTGILDWTDAAITDPARDFGRLYRDCGPTVVDAALAGYGAGPGLRERAIFYGRCAVFEDIAHGLETGKRVYAENAIAALGWLFPA